MSDLVDRLSVLQVLLAERHPDHHATVREAINELAHLQEEAAECHQQPISRKGTTGRSLGGRIGAANSKTWRTAMGESVYEPRQGVVMQDDLMKFDPATGEPRPYPSHAGQWRDWNGKAAWLFDPWTGRRRNARDVGSDTQGLLIAPAKTIIRNAHTPREAWVWFDRTGMPTSVAPITEDVGAGDGFQVVRMRERVGPSGGDLPETPQAAGGMDRAK